MKAGIWARVSTDDQDSSNQLKQLKAMAESRGYKVVHVYQTSASAWNGKHRAKLQEAIHDAHKGQFQVLLVWALDRLSREGIEATMKAIRQFGECGVAIISHQEPWLNGSSEVQELLLAITAWKDEQESKRRSERIKAGLQRLKSEGKPIGRPPGAKDKGPRKKSGYYKRHEDERASQ